MKQQNIRRKIVVVRGDIQSGHDGGLCNPKTKLPTFDITEDGIVCVGWDTPKLSPVQKMLWKWHAEDVAKVKALAGDDEIVMVEMGDLTQGSLFRDNLAETSLSAQYFIAKASLYPWLDLKNLNRCYITLGTPAHNWGAGSSETMLTHHLSAEYPNKKIFATSHYLIDVDGFGIDVAHHGASAGIRNWTRGNVLRLYAQSVLADDVAYGIKPPNLLLRGHFHEFTASHATMIVGDKLWELPAYITPPYCFIGAHAEKVCKSPSRMTVGVVAFELINGQLVKTHPFIHGIDLRTREVL